MGKFALALAGAALLLQTERPAPAQVPPPNPPSPGAASKETPAITEATNRIVFFSAWDDDYLYVAFQVNKPTIRGKNSKAFSNPLEDDAVILSFQTDNDRDTKIRTPKTVTIAVSAAGGTQVYTGPTSQRLYNGLEDFQAQFDAIFKNETDDTKKRAKTAALLATLVKSSVSAKGAMRAIGTPAAGYTAEVAIPWADLGGKPQAETKMGFHIAAQSIGDGSPALQSLSSRVASAADLDNPSLWSQIAFRNAPAPLKDGTYTCPRIFGGKPEIDGDLNNGEWNGLSRLVFGANGGAGNEGGVAPATLAARYHPKFTPHESRPVVPIANRSRFAAPPPHQKQHVGPLLLAQYTYWYQGDARQAAPAEHVSQADGSTALAQHPLPGTGPWLSYERADWHRQQLIEARRAGIDVILPMYRGGVQDRQRYADKGLMVLATALQSLQAAGQDYPQVGLFLDTTSLSETLGEKTDLREANVQAALYGLVRDFYRQIPAQFRYTLTLNGRRACPVFLSDAHVFKAFDATFVSYLRSHFAADFDGTDLVVIGSADFKPQAGLDGYFGNARDPKEKSFAFDGDGWIKTAVVGAGYDTSYMVGANETPVIKPRRDGDTYRAAWTAALAKHPDWVLLDGWNDFSTGANLAPSLEIGYTGDDMTRLNSRLLNGFAPNRVKFLHHDVPASLVSGQTANLHLRVQNAGTELWAANALTGTPVSFAYRWRQGEQVIAEGTKVPLTHTVNAGDNIGIALPVQASDAKGAALADGDYILEISAVQEKKKNTLDWMGEGSETLRVPVHIVRGENGADWAATLVQTDLPRMVEAGSVYKVTATLRNDGTATWHKSEGTRVSLRLYRSERMTGAPTDETTLTETPVDMADATAELPQDVAPGQEVTVTLQLPLMDAQGNPLPLWSAEYLWTYTARWEVAKSVPQTALVQPIAAGRVENIPSGVSIAPTPLAVVAYDFGARFTADGTPPSLPGQRRLPVRLSLYNGGPQAWKPENVRVGYHWYYQDGTEFLWEDETTPLTRYLPKDKTDVQPGERVNDLLAWVTAPPFDGTYWLVWDVKVGDTWASTTGATRPFDEIARTVKVIGGRLVWTDLTKAFNTDGTSEEGETFDGSLDGQGRTLPASLVPPFADMTIVPVGMWLPVAKTGPDSPRRISFRWGPKDAGAKNFIACQGQRVELGKQTGACRVLHILAASTGKEVLTDLKLVFQEPSTQSQDAYAFAVSAWDRPPTRGEEVAYVARRYHDRKGVEAGAVALYHYTIKIRDPRNLVALILPDAPDIKIAAVTLEK